MSCDIKEENVDSTDFALDEIVCSFLNEFLSVYTRFSISVRFFLLIEQYSLSLSGLLSKFLFATNKYNTIF